VPAANGPCDGVRGDGPTFDIDASRPSDYPIPLVAAVYLGCGLGSCYRCVSVSLGAAHVGHSSLISRHLSFLLA